MYDSKTESVTEAMKNWMAIGRTSDFWTYLGNESNCGIVGHWITDDWNLLNVVLECVHVFERHNSTNIDELCKQCGKDRNITENIHVLLTDNARNVALAVNQAGYAHIPCLAHRLQLSIFL